MNAHCKFVKRVQREPENDKPGQIMAIDEIVTGPVDCVHVERMDDNSYWIGIYKGKECQAVWITSARAKIQAGTEKQ